MWKRESVQFFLTPELQTSMEVSYCYFFYIYIYYIITFDTVVYMLEYELPQEAGYKLSTIFSSLQSLGDYLEDFSVSQTTLEQVFLKLAREKEQVTCFAF